MKINWLYIGIGAVVLYLVHRYMNDSEDFANAGGRSWLSKADNKPCICNGQWIGNMPTGRCTRKCRKANYYEFH